MDYLSKISKVSVVPALLLWEEEVFSAKNKNNCTYRLFLNVFFSGRNQNIYLRAGGIPN